MTTMGLTMSKNTGKSRGGGRAARQSSKAQVSTPKQAETTVEQAEVTRLQRLGKRLGPNGAWALWAGLSAALTAALALGAYLMVVWVATQVVPMVGLFTSNFVGMPLAELDGQTALIYWVGPTVFLMLVLLVLTLVVLHQAWRWRTRTIAKLKSALTGMLGVAVEGKAVPPMGPAVLRLSRDRIGLKNEEKN